MSTARCRHDRRQNRDSESRSRPPRQSHPRCSARPVPCPCGISDHLSPPADGTLAGWNGEMKRSTQRILTTHVGSLSRPRELLDVMREKEHGRPYDTATFDRLVREAVDHVVKKQVESGIDIVADGEMGKVTFLTYVKERLNGFEPDPAGVQSMPPSWNREIEMFPDYYRDYFGKYSETVAPFTRLMSTGLVAYIGQAAIKADIETLKAAMNGLAVEEAFMPATSAYGFGRNAYYASEDEYVEAVGAAMREEYLTIIDAGLILQIDDPWLTEALSDDSATTPEQRYAIAVRHV